MRHLFGVISKNAKLKVKNLAQTTSGFSRISYRAPWLTVLLTNVNDFFVANGQKRLI